KIYAHVTYENKKTFSKSRTLARKRPSSNSKPLYTYDNFSSFVPHFKKLAYQDLINQFLKYYAILIMRFLYGLSDALHAMLILQPLLQLLFYHLSDDQKFDPIALQLNYDPKIRCAHLYLPTFL